MKLTVKHSDSSFDWQEMEKKYFDRVEEERLRKEQEEQAKADKLKALQEMTPAEYVAYRTGKPVPLSNEELEALSMEEYIKARSR